MLKTGLCIVLFALAAGCAPKQKPLTDYVNPLLGTATLWDSVDLGFKPTKRTWGAEVFPGSSLPNAMVQVSPVTKFHSGAGYQYEDSVIYGFTHTNKGHWNLCHIPLLPVTGTPLPGDYCSPYSHARESAAPGYYRVFLDRYGVDAELTSTLRCAFHKYTYPAGAQAALLADLQRSNEHVRAWDIRKEGDNAFAGWQQTGEKMYFYAVADRPVTGIEPVAEGDREIRIVRFGDGDGPVELRIGFSFVSEENARKNLEAEMLGRSFADVRSEATAVWNDLLGRIRVEGGTEREKGLFYSCLYRSFLWPALRSDVNGEFTDADGEVVNTGFRYYTGPSYWDDYRNKLILLGLLAPDVAADVISSDTDRGEKRGGFMPTFFHGDHASAFVAGVYLRGIRGFDVRRAYELVLRNATVQGPIRPWLDEYVARGYIPEMDVENPVTQTVCKAAVTKTLEYAYDDYAVALLADVLGDGANRDMLMKRTSNYKNLFDPSTGLMRGRLDDGSWITPFDDQYPYYEYMYREANAWQQAFFAPARYRGADRSLSQPRGVRGAVGQALLDSVEGLRGGQPFGFYRAVLPRQPARPQFPLPVLLHRPSGAFAGAARPHSGPVLRHGTRRTGVVGHGRRRRDVVVVCLQRHRALHLFPGRSRIYRHRAAVRQGRSVAGRRFPLVDPPRGNGPPDYGHHVRRKSGRWLVRVPRCAGQRRTGDCDLG